ncbi:hypothetical protein [Streptomyces sp. NPDC006739]|uniref:hypothetical protein n=1 Tax=Streptomyces sp. NPDC006739 TaxID=3364763 RepID=UPI0036A66469
MPEPQATWRVPAGPGSWWHSTTASSERTSLKADSKREEFDAIDTDNDGYITAAELRAALDGNGRISDEHISIIETAGITRMTSGTGVAEKQMISRPTSLREFR